MGAWNNSYFGNDGAGDFLAGVGRGDAAALQDAIEKAVFAFEAFLSRDAKGETYRPSTPEELAQDDLAVREALADLPELLAQWDSGPSANPESLLCDTGDYEAQAVVAAAAIAALKMEASIVSAPKGFVLPRDFSLSAGLNERLVRALDAVISHARIRGYVSTGWLRNVGKLRDFYMGKAQ